ncbi:1-phosphofructokinase family hexose kinase [Streptomyces sp. WMMC500]|uniref:1-phosphofructokinase family hexose kinase n=1 Tax=Streptomyces sp. WMMC500 TaxID=3015154 RepID=UPI00248AC01D|nr:1-phosphofructokinase family hexose kinase [Streptomyces sp. WMMC500]WBB64521.1 1-phosphofructokinase family hexose kinase [Streptomyces sp. WMMC500]
MFLTVTLNLALDLTYRVPRLRAHESHRITDVTERPGGKGLNVARVLAALGHPVTVTGFAGGPTGAHVRALLAAESGARTDAPRAEAARTAVPVTDALVEVAGTTRRTIAVVDGSTGDTTQLNEAGPEIAAAEWAAFRDVYAALLTDAGAAAGAAAGEIPGEAARAGASPVRAVALCGSLPPGVPVGAYAELVRAAHAAGVPVLLDTSGEPLRRGVAARPDLVKPNAAELAQLTGATEPLRAADDARRRGARAVVASLGAAGLLAVTADGTWRAAPPRHVPGNPTGAGDSAVAGLLSGLAEGLGWPDRLARAVALSAATVAAPVAGEFDTDVYAETLPRIEITSGRGAARDGA